MTLETVLYDARNGIARIRLHRPHRLNAMVPQLMRDLHQRSRRPGAIRPCGS